MIEVGKQSSASFHLSGVVPVAGQELDFDFPWHDSLVPINKSYLAVERAVLECAWAGCETIWVVCHADAQPLIKERVGEWVYDPVSLLEKGIFQSTKRKRIAIYYVPIHPKDRERRDCLGWSVLYGALSSYYISKRMSRWLIPDKFYCAFPYGVYDPALLKAHRKKISSKNNFCLTYEGKSVINGEYLGFSFDGEDFKKCRRAVRQRASASCDSEGNLLPIEKRWSGRNFSLDIVFEHVIIGNEVEVENYHNIGSWEGYVDFLSSKLNYEKPDFFKSKKWNMLGGEFETKSDD